MQAAHRKHTFITALLYKFWPRLAFFYVYIYSYDGIFLPLLQDQLHHPEDVELAAELDFEPGWTLLILFLCEVLLIPHFIVFSYAWDWWSQHPWICSAIIVPVSYTHLTLPTIYSV